MDVERVARALARHDARALLTAVLQREEAVIGKQRGIFMPEDAEDTAFMPGFRVVRIGKHGKRAQIIVRSFFGNSPLACPATGRGAA